MSFEFSPEETAIIAELSDIADIASAEKLAHGHESKYRVTTRDGEKRLLRVNGTEHYDWLEGDFRMYEYITSAGINAMKPISMGKFHGGELAYQLYTWLDGIDLASALPGMSTGDRFATGLKAGKLMRALHSLPPMGKPEPWHALFGKKIEAAIGYMNDNPGICKHGGALAEYLLENAELFNNRPLAFIHGDWNPENLMLTDDGQVALIDLSGENDCGDPWWEFRDMFSVDTYSSEFFIGQIKGYFDGEPPAEFFKLLSLYAAYCALDFLRYREDDSGPDQTEIIMNWFGNMRDPVPEWYK